MMREVPLYHQMNGGIHMNQLVTGKFIALKRKQKNLTQELEKQKNMLYGIILVVMGIALQALSYAVGGSDFRDFISGLLLGLSIAEMLVGIFVVGKSLLS